MTIGDDRVIRAIEVAVDAHPFSVCPEMGSNYQRLVGEEISPGFTARLHRLVGHVEGCSHLDWLVQCVSRVALQTLSSQIARARGVGLDAVFGRPGGADHPALIDSCHAYAADGEIVKTLYPDHFRGPK